jgi:hypothetical protein
LFFKWRSGVLGTSFSGEIAKLEPINDSRGIFLKKGGGVQTIFE